MKNIIFVAGIRPDLIRLPCIFKKLDENFNLTIVHSGQHYDKMLCDVFFDDLQMRQPDYNLNIGGPGKKHYHQSADASVRLLELIDEQNLDPDIVLYIGDSNSVVSAVSVKKEGYKVGHIEAGMRSYDRRMLEEINRITCDHCSDILFVYHTDYREICRHEGISWEKIVICGNTSVEVCAPYVEQLTKKPKKKDFILVDIHRPENFLYPDRLKKILSFINRCGSWANLPVKMLKFPRAFAEIEKLNLDLGVIRPIELMTFSQHMQAQYDAAFMISDSGSAQEEPALLNTPVLVPRDFTERPQSMINNCSKLVKMGDENGIVSHWYSCFDWARKHTHSKKEWLGEGKTSEIITQELLKRL